MAWQGFARSSFRESQVSACPGGVKAPCVTAEGGNPVRKRVLIDSLHGAIGRIENRIPGLTIPDSGTGDGQGRLRLGMAQIDAALGSRGPSAHALHEVRSEVAADLPAAAGFALALGGFLAGSDREIFWIRERRFGAETGDFHGPGLAALGLDPGLLVRVLTRDCGEALWAAGEVAATHGVGLCLLELCGNPAVADLAFSRRLALRAQRARVPVILLRQSGREEASAAVTRWCIRPASSLQEKRQQWVGPPAWNVVLEKCRGGRPGEWNLEWNPHERLFAPIPDDTTIQRNPAAVHGGAAVPGGQPALAFHRPARPAAVGGGLAHERAS